MLRKKGHTDKGAYIYINAERGVYDKSFATASGGKREREREEQPAAAALREE